MSDLFRDFLVWLMSFTGCSILVFAAACFARNQFQSRQKQVAEKQPAGAETSNSSSAAQLSRRRKWLVFALAPILYLLLLGPALSELNAHFQKIQSERAALSKTAEIPRTIEPIPDSIGSRSLSQIGYRISNNQYHSTSPCSCRKNNQENTLTQSANVDVSSDDVPSDDVSLDSDESGWVTSPGGQLSTGDMHDVAEGDVAEVALDVQVD